jgi:hypothetical protein
MKKLITLFAIAGLVLAVGTVAQAGTATYRAVVLADNPSVYYEFDETSGTSAPNIGTLGASHDGTITASGPVYGNTGGSVTIDNATFLNGGTSYDFGGGHVRTAALPASLTEWTLEAWINWDSAKTSNSGIFGNDKGGFNNDVLFGIGPDDGAPASTIGVSVQANGLRDLAANPNPTSAGVWHHVVATGDNGSGVLKVYLNGQQVGTKTSTGDITMDRQDRNGSLAVGSVDTAGFRAFDGFIDEFALYGTALDATTITAHYNAGLAVVIPEVIPEPSTLTLSALGLLGLLAYRRRR